MFSKDRIKAQPATSAAKRPEPPKATTPWKPADLCAPPQGCVLPPGWGGRWVRADSKQGDDRIQAKQDEGWTIWDRSNPPWKSGEADSRAKKGGSGDPNVDGSDISSAAKRRNLVYMVLSPERKAARERYLYELSQSKKDGLKDPVAEAILAEKK